MEKLPYQVLDACPKGLPNKSGVAFSRSPTFPWKFVAMAFRQHKISSYLLLPFPSTRGVPNYDRVSAFLGAGNNWERAHLKIPHKITKWLTSLATKSVQWLDYIAQ